MARSLRRNSSLPGRYCALAITCTGLMNHKHKMKKTQLNTLWQRASRSEGKIGSVVSSRSMAWSKRFARSAGQRKMVADPISHQWRWGSAWRKEYGTEKQKKLLTPWPVSRPHDYLHWLNESQTQEEEDAIERSVIKSIPYGRGGWTDGVIKRYGLEQTLRSVGRPKKNGG